MVMSPSLTFVNWFAVLLFVYCGYSCVRALLFHKRARGFPLPPGPRRLPIIGNALDIPLEKPWYMFTKWKQQFGDMVYTEALGNGILVVNSIQAVNDLLDKRGHIYSDRPAFTMVGHLMGLDNSTPMLPYDSVFKKQRRLCHAALSQEAVKKYIGIQEDAVALFIDSLIDEPSEFVPQLRLTAGRIIMAITYGLSVQTPEDVYISEAEETMEMIGKATMPGAFLVDIIPALRHLPGWFPFNNIHKTAEYGRNLIFSMVNRPFQHVKQEMGSGTAKPSFTSHCLEIHQSELADVNNAEAERLILWTAGAMYGAGGESTYASILTFIYAMASYPDVQRKIQRELDSVIGADRFPSIRDRRHLPYTCAAIKELMRWRPALPLSIARQTNRDDYYNGYFIPKGTVILPNVWTISNDDKSGLSPADFAPERFMTECVKQVALDPYLYTFGFGRRVCPGRFLGDNNLFLLVSWIITMVNISKPKDKEGNELPLNPTYSNGLVSYLLPFNVSIVPRSKERISMLKNRVSEIQK